MLQIRAETDENAVQLVGWPETPRQRRQRLGRQLLWTPIRKALVVK